MESTYKVVGRVNCILSPLGDKESVSVSSVINSVIKQQKNKLGRVLLDVYVYDEDLQHLNHAWKLDIVDNKNEIKKLEDWLTQIYIKSEYRIMKYITKENWTKMIESLIQLRHEIKEKLINTKIQDD